MLRLDTWLDIACIFRTRSESQRACKGGKISLNEHRAKPHNQIHIGDELDITFSGGRKRRLSVTGLAESHIPKNEAKALYRDITPPPTPDERELRDLLRLAGQGNKGIKNGRSIRRDRQASEKLRHGN
jgi:ribosome-associated heat shock protein Hsp15